MFLFSYGSNSPRQLGERLGRTVKGTAALLADHRRIFRGWSNNWDGGVASIEKHRGGTVYGWIAKVSNDDLTTLDRYEGVAAGRYKRSTITVDTQDGDKVKAVVYVSLARDFNKPSRAYLEAIAETISSFWSDDEPISWKSISINPSALENPQETKTIHIKALPPGTDLSGGYDSLKRWGDVMALVDADGFDPETIARRYVVRPSNVPAQERLQRIRADVKYGNKSYTEQPFYYYDNRSPHGASQGQFEDAVVYLIPVDKFADLTVSEDSAVQKILREKGYREAWKYPLTAAKWKKILAMGYEEARDHADYEIANAVDQLGPGWDFPGVYALTKKGAIKWVVSRNREGGGL